jgi:hypothetical protein
VHLKMTSSGLLIVASLFFYGHLVSPMKLDISIFRQQQEMQDPASSPEEVPCLTIQVIFEKNTELHRLHGDVIDGTYTLREGETTNGKPDWVHSGEEYAMWYGSWGHWIIGLVSDRGENGGTIVSLRYTELSSPLKETEWQYYVSNRNTFETTMDIAMVCKKAPTKVIPNVQPKKGDVQYKESSEKCQKQLNEKQCKSVAESEKYSWRGSGDWSDYSPDCFVYTDGDVFFNENSLSIAKLGTKKFLCLNVSL